jgi:hypothetical protein
VQWDVVVSWNAQFTPSPNPRYAVFLKDGNPAMEKSMETEELTPSRKRTS